MSSDLAAQCLAWARQPELMVPTLSVEAPLTARERLLLGSALESVANRLDAAPTCDRCSERRSLIKVLQATGWSEKRSAERLGITPRMMGHRMARHGLRKKDLAQAMLAAAN